MIIKKNCYTVLDMVSEVYSQFPFPAANDNDAIRAFSQVINSQDSEWGKNPLDYVLFHCGTYNMATGQIAGTDIIKKLVAGVDVLMEEKENE